jgi:chromosome segregation ATPase
MMAECRRLLENTSREVAAQMDRAVARATASDGKVARLEIELEVANDDLQKMKEIVASNKMQHQGLEKKMNDLQDHLFSLRDSLRKSFIGLHQLALACGVMSSIPTHLDETSLTLALSELAGEMEVIPSRHTAKVSKEISNGIHTGRVTSSRA